MLTAVRVGRRPAFDNVTENVRCVPVSPIKKEKERPADQIEEFGSAERRVRTRSLRTEGCGTRPTEDSGVRGKK
jgi:hypothetical protein